MLDVWNDLRVVSWTVGRGITALGSTAYFAAFDAATGLELWKSDGTAAGTVMVHEIRPGINGGNPMELYPFRGRLFFRADDGTGEELWSTDGTSAGTVQVKDINSTGDASPTCLAEIKGELWFSANDGTDGFADIWRTDGTEAGPRLFVNEFSIGAPCGFVAIGTRLIAASAGS